MIFLYLQDQEERGGEGVVLVMESNTKVMKIDDDHSKNHFCGEKI